MLLLKIVALSSFILLYRHSSNGDQTSEKDVPKINETRVQQWLTNFFLLQNFKKEKPATCDYQFQFIYFI